MIGGIRVATVFASVANGILAVRSVNLGPQRCSYQCRVAPLADSCPLAVCAKSDLEEGVAKLAKLHGERAIR